MEENMTQKAIPERFCWTKMGSESGESLDCILKRKELERKAGKGLFFWGIGNSLGSKISRLTSVEVKPRVLFSRIKTKANKIDIEPEKIYSWSDYMDSSGNMFKIPQGSLVLSRALSKKALKKKHYALVCHKEEPIKKENWSI